MPEKESESNDSSSDGSYSDEATPDQKPETVYKEIKTTSEYRCRLTVYLEKRQPSNNFMNRTISKLVKVNVTRWATPDPTTD